MRGARRQDHRTGSGAHVAPCGDSSREGFALGGIDLADVRELLVAGGQRVDRGDGLVVEHLVEAGVASDAGDVGTDGQGDGSCGHAAAKFLDGERAEEMLGVGQ